MLRPRSAVSLMLIASVPLLCLTTKSTLVHDRLHGKNFDIVARDVIDTPTGTISSCSDNACVTTAPTSHLPCGGVNGALFAGNNSIWTMLCDTDFFAQDIYPFILATTFEECMQYCEEYNYAHGQGKCAGFVFAPDRVHLDNSCYLKSSLNDVVSPATVHLIAGVLHPTTATSTMVTPIPAFTSASTIIVPQLEPTIITSPKIGSKGSSSEQSQEKGKRPTITDSTYLGTSVDEVASQYVSHAPAKPKQLSADVLEANINIDLITDFPLALDTGSWTSSDSNGLSVSQMKVMPRLSRDGGRGGNINGTNIFIFCDTSTYGEDKDPILGYLNGFVSSSVAIDQDMHALNGKALSLVNPLGQWQDDVGRMRGWVPMTDGEEAFNIAISGQGYRFAVWPNASPIPLNQTHSIMYASLVYLEVDMQDQSSPRYTSLGNTLLLVSIDPMYGPHAERLHNQFFEQHEVNWGSLGGIRAWNSSTQNDLEGYIYVFGQAEGGVLLGKVTAEEFDDRTKYNYWDGHSWSEEMPPSNSSPDAFIIDRSVMNMDMIYSPAHKTFIMIYLTSEADNTFYFRYLVSKDNENLSIVPPYEAKDNIQFVEEILTNAWSDEEVLFSIPAPARGYAYAGGLHAGYFGSDDIANGGTKMLCTWTEHTEVDPEKPESGYAHKSQIVELGFLD